MPKKPKLEEIKVVDLKIDDEYDVIDKSATIIDAAKKIREKKIPDLVVIDSDNKVMGSISTFDIVTKVVAEEKDLKMPVSEIMVKVKPFSLETKVVDAFNFMKEQEVETVPVADEEGKLLGVVTVMDVFNAVEYFSS